MAGFLVTGGCGFIGQHTVARLLNEGATFVRVVDNLSHGKLENLTRLADVDETAGARIATPKKPIQFVRADIRDDSIAKAACRDVDTIIHLAANTGVAPSVEDPRFDCLVNVIGTLNYLEGARKARVRRFIFASSGATIGETNPPIHELLPARPVSPYGASKLAGEAYCSAYTRTFGISTVALRFGNVYGPRCEHKSSVVAKFIRHAFAKEALPIFGDGTQTRDFIYIDDLIRAVFLATITEGIDGELFQIATAQETSVAELARSLCSVLDSQGMYCPQIEFQKPRAGDVARNYADTTKARERLGWYAQVGLTEGLRRTVEWAQQSAAFGNFTRASD
jgi:UDP-glucose 4-epimerase